MPRRSTSQEPPSRSVVGGRVVGVRDPLVVEVGAALRRPCAAPRPCSSTGPARPAGRRSPGSAVAARDLGRARLAQRGRQRRRRRARAASPPPNSAADAALIRSVSSAPCTRVVTCSASAFCPARRNGFSRGLRLEVLDLSWLEEREDPQQLADLLVLDVEPELVEGVGRQHLGVEPQGAALGLAVLRAVGPGHQRGGERVHLAAVGAPDQLDAAGDVAPLVAAAELQGDAVVAVEVEEVHRLQQHVAELGVGDARPRAGCGPRRGRASG